MSSVSQETLADSLSERVPGYRISRLLIDNSNITGTTIPNLLKFHLMLIHILGSGMHSFLANLQSVVYMISEKVTLGYAGPMGRVLYVVSHRVYQLSSHRNASRNESSAPSHVNISSNHVSNSHSTSIPSSWISGAVCHSSLYQYYQHHRYDVELNQDVVPRRPPSLPLGPPHHLLRRRSRPIQSCLERQRQRCFQDMRPHVPAGSANHQRW